MLLKKISFTILFIIGNITFMQADETTKTFIGVSSVGLLEGSSGDGLNSHFPGFGLKAGYYMTEKLSLAGEVLYTRPEYGTQKVDVVDYIGSVNYDLDAINSTVPFISTGFGYRTISDVSDRDDWSFILGAGIKIPLNDSFQLTGDAKARWNLEKDEQGMLGTIGVNYSF